ncbi:MAG: hypothetical protein JRD89_21305 [Deltaproteobacteria bacterium]|nr:hypothetical protein [Deltaproteobacteria bacterium]
MIQIITKGIKKFLGLTDTPDSYSGYAQKYLRVKSTEDGLEFATVAAHQIIDADGDSYESVEPSADADEAVTYLQNVLVRKFHTSGILDLPKQSRISIYRSGNQLIPADTNTKVQFNAKYIDIHNECDITTNFRWTATEDGDYLIHSNLVYVNPPGSQNYYQIKLFKNGGTTKIFFIASPTGYRFSHQIIALISCAAGDYIEVFLYNFETNSLAGDSAQCWLDIIKVA